MGVASAETRSADRPEQPKFPWLEVNGRIMPIPSEGEAQSPDIELPIGTLRFRSGPGSDLVLPLRRYRCKLEGCDGEWREPESDMRLVVVFLDVKSEWVAETPFIFKGESPGWRGIVDGSPLMARTEVVRIPTNAAKISVLLTSAGPPDSIGTIALGGLTVSRIGPAGELLSPLLKLQLLQQERAGAEPIAPPGWVRGGSRPTMAQMMPSATAPSGRVLAVVDDNPEAHGEWQSPHCLIGGGVGDRLRVDWLACFSISKALNPSVFYGRLTPGRYVLRYQAMTPAGQPCGEVRSLSLVVLPPVWQRDWFIALCGILAAGAALGLVRFVWWRRARREIARLQQQAALEAERTRIARDIHDDLGSTLAQISMLSQSVDPGTASVSELVDNLTTINRAAKEMTQAMDEIVWAVNPRNDRLDRLVSFLASHAHGFLASAGIESVFDNPEPVPEWLVSAPTRHNLFMAFKEALANAAVHSGCHKIQITLTISGRTLGVDIRDDGRGFVAVPEPAVGNGLSNMRRRVESLGGRFRLESQAGQGTRVVFEVPLEG
jgi:signal transduction histidine kinase